MPTQFPHNIIDIISDIDSVVPDKISISKDNLSKVSWDTPVYNLNNGVVYNTPTYTPTQELFEDIDQLDIEFLEMYLKKFPKSVKRALKYSIDCNCVTVDFIRACLEIEPSLYKIVIDNANKIHLDEDDKEDLKRIIQAASIVCL